MVKDFDSGNNVDGVDGAGAGVGEDGDENVLLDVEGSRIESEFPACSSEEHALSDRCGHELAERHHRDLGGDRSDGERLDAVPEELVQERQQHA